LPHLHLQLMRDKPGRLLPFQRGCVLQALAFLLLGVTLADGGRVHRWRPPDVCEQAFDGNRLSTETGF
jgi:hypothetical protein